MNCKHCSGTGVEPTADGLRCHRCHPERRDTNSSEVPAIVAESVDGYFVFEAIGDAVSAAGSGIGTTVEGVGSAAGAVIECIGEILGAALE